MKLVKSTGTFCIADNRGEPCRVSVYPRENGNMLFRFYVAALDLTFFVIRYNRAEYYMICNGFRYNGKPHTVVRIRITDFFPGWRISKMPLPFDRG